MKIKTFATLAFATVTLQSTGCAAASKRSPNSFEDKIYTFESDANGFNTKNYFYDNGEEVIAFDTQFTPEIAKKSIEYLKSKTSNPITYVVITHPNPDKFNGMSEFQKIGAKVIASNRTANNMEGVHKYKKAYFVNIAKMFTEENYPTLSQVDITFEDQFDLRLKNGERICLLELTKSGVSTNQTIASILSLNAVIVGDLVHHKAHAWLEGGIVDGTPTPNLNGWISDLMELRGLFRDAPKTIVYGGRGEAAFLESAVKDQIIYLKRSNQILNAYLKNLGDRLSELGSNKAADHYIALQSLIEKAFPTYKLGYMIQYGIYGLVNAKLK